MAFGDEMMVADDSLDARFSVMSLAVAADSGWYEVNFEKADLYDWGHDRGCLGLGSESKPQAKSKSDSRPACARTALSDFCKYPGTTGCSSDFKYISLCKRTLFTAECKLRMNDQSCKRAKRAKRSGVKAFRYGRFSICQQCRVESTAWHNRQKSNGDRFGECFAVKCNRDRTKYKVFTHTGKKKLTFVCDRSGKKSRDIRYDFDFVCQDPRDVCQPQTSCPFDCHHRWD